MARPNGIMTRQSPEILDASRQGQSEHYGRGVLFMVISLTVFTGNALLLKYIGSRTDVSIWLALFVRAFVGLILTWSIMRRTFGRVDFYPFLADKLMVWRGLVGVIGTACFYFTIPVLGAGKSTLIGSTYILFAALLATFFLKELLPRVALLWMIVAFVGVALLTSAKGNGASSAHFGFAESIAIFGAVNAAAAVMIIRRLTRMYNSPSIYLCQCVYLVIFSIPVLPFVYAWPGWINLAIIVGAGASATVGQIAMNTGYRHLPIATGASIQMALPVTASIGGIFIFGETFEPLQLAGAFLIVLGCYRVVVSRKK